MPHVSFALPEARPETSPYAEHVTRLLAGARPTPAIIGTRIRACQAGCPRIEFRLGAMAQVSGTLSHDLSGQDVFVIVLLALALVAAISLTAVWTGDKDRRKAALAVLDRLIRWWRW